MQNAFYGHKNLYDCVSTDCSISCITEITNSKNFIWPSNRSFKKTAFFLKLSIDSMKSFKMEFVLFYLSFYAKTFSFLFTWRAICETSCHKKNLYFSFCQYILSYYLYRWLSISVHIYIYIYIYYHFRFSFSFLFHHSFW